MGPCDRRDDEEFVGWAKRKRAHLREHALARWARRNAPLPTLQVVAALLAMTVGRFSCHDPSNPPRDSHAQILRLAPPARDLPRRHPRIRRPLRRRFLQLSSATISAGSSQPPASRKPMIISQALGGRHAGSGGARLRSPPARHFPDKTFEQYVATRVGAGPHQDGDARRCCKKSRRAVLADRAAALACRAQIIVAIWGLEIRFRQGRHRQDCRCFACSPPWRMIAVAPSCSRAN